MKDITVAYQGVPGAYSHLACDKVFPTAKLKKLKSFHEAMFLVEEGKVDFAMIPVENSSAGRVEEIYQLMPKMKLSIVAEHFEPIKHTLLTLKGTSIEDIKYVSSHPQALAQCMNNIKKLNFEAIAKFDTAGSAQELNEFKDKYHAVIASSLAAKIYNLEILDDDFADYDGNVTRFLILSKKANIPIFDKKRVYITSLIVTLRNIPAALYKALGGFATNGIDLLKIESYSQIGSLDSTSFHIDLYGHTDEKKLQLALEELSFFSQELRILGVFERNEHRDNLILK